MTKEEIIMLTIDDLVTDFLYYDRKEDHTLQVGEIEQLIQSKTITLEEMVERFRINLTRNL